MNIGVLIDFPTSGGLQTTALQEVISLQKLGHKPVLIILSKTPNSQNFLHTIKNIPHQFIIANSLKLPFFSFFSTAHILSPVIALVKVKKLDYIISHNSTTTFTALSLKMFKGIPYSAIVHDPLPVTLVRIYPTFMHFLYPFAFISELIVLKFANLVAIDSYLHEKFVITKYHITPRVVPLGVNPPKKPLTKLGNYLLATSRWQMEKHPDLLLKLMLSLPQIKLIIAGEWLKDLGWFKKIVKSFKLKNRVQIITSFSESQRPVLYKKSLAWIHPNQEAFGLDGLLAASYGLPVLMPKGSGVLDLVGQELTLGNLRKVTKNKTYAQKLGSKNYKLVKDKFTWLNHTQKLLP